VQRIRVLVANRPRLMRELVLATISDQPDIEVVGEIQDDSQILEIAGQVSPDCLIIALEESGVRPKICDELLERWPNMKILALAAKDNISIYYWATLVIRSNRVETSEEGILSALRGQTNLADTLGVAASQKIN
jgi:DNA-binding NarL/FixJ family response regulator